MLPFEDRYSRQRRLPEVGPEGQRQLARSHVKLPPHADVELEREYLERAGVGAVEIDPRALRTEFPWATEFRFAAPLAVARGAYGALSKIRMLLGR